VGFRVCPERKEDLPDQRQPCGGPRRTEVTVRRQIFGSVTQLIDCITQFDDQVLDVIARRLASVRAVTGGGVRYGMVAIDRGSTTVRSE